MSPGVSETIRDTSSSGIPALSTQVCISLSMVATLPAMADLSDSMHTPSSIITRGSKAFPDLESVHASICDQAHSSQTLKLVYKLKNHGGHMDAVGYNLYIYAIIEKD